MKPYIMQISFHWPHDRFALGWDWIRPSFEFNARCKKSS